MSAIPLDPLIAEAKERTRRRRLLAFGAVLIVAVAIATPLAIRSSRPPLGVGAANACGITTAGPGLQILLNGQAVYRAAAHYPHPISLTSQQVQCSGSSIWVVWLTGAAMSQVSYYGVHSSDAGRTWRPAFGERYFGWRVPHELDADWGPWTLRGNSAYFAGSCVACSTESGQGTVSVYVTRDGGRTFETYEVPALTGYRPTRIHVSGHSITVVGNGLIRGVAPHKTATVRVG